jgi:hypothetical protein
MSHTYIHSSATMPIRDKAKINNKIFIIKYMCLTKLNLSSPLVELDLTETTLTVVRQTEYN